jgi:quercetin dioxygenase-like cupin family protein
MPEPGSAPPALVPGAVVPGAFIHRAFIHHALGQAGRALLPDTDHLLARTNAGALLLIHVPPGEYPFEEHAATEYIVCINGRIELESDNHALAHASAGDMLEIPPGLRHRFGKTSDAVILTIAQEAA